MRHTLCVIGLIAAASVLTPNAGAAVNCSNDLLTGVYGLRISGMLRTSLTGGVAGAGLTDAIAARLKAGAAGSNAAAGYARLFMDGAGGVSGTSAASIVGIWSEGPVVGQYAVKEDCTFTLTLTDVAGGTQHLEGVLTRTGDSASLLQTDTGTGVSGLLKRSNDFCDGSALPANLKMQTSGAVGSSGPLNSVGLVEIGNDGGITAIESRFSNGAVSRVASTGTMTINADCTVSFSLTSTADGSVAAYRGMLVNGGRELMVVRSDAGAIVSGDAAVQ